MSFGLAMLREMLERQGYLIQAATVDFPFDHIDVSLPDGRMQRVVIEAGDDREIHGIPHAGFIGVATIREKGIDPSKLWPLMEADPDRKGRWIWSRLENGLTMVGYAVDVPLTEHLDASDLEKTFLEIASLSDKGDAALNAGGDTF